MAKKKTANRQRAAPALIALQIVAALIVAYVLTSIAIDSGHLLVYLATIITVVYALTRMPKLFKR